MKVFTKGNTLVTHTCTSMAQFHDSFYYVDASYWPTAIMHDIEAGKQIVS